MYKIGIMGKANSGKNTLARIIKNSLRNEVVKQGKSRYLSASYMAFANPIKEMIRAMYPEIPKRFLYGPSTLRNEIIAGAFKNGQPLTIRQLLIDIGTSAREYDPDIWLKNFDVAYKKARYYSLVVVTDVRFRNEIEHLKAQNFQMIRLYRDTNLLSNNNINHISETGQDDIKDDEFDYVIHNNKSLKQLKHDVMYNIIPRLRDI